MQAGQIALAVAAVVFSLIGAFYYLRIVKLMYFDEPPQAAAGDSPVAMAWGARFLFSANSLVLLVLGILPQTLMYLCLEAIRVSV